MVRLSIAWDDGGPDTVLGLSVNGEPVVRFEDPDGPDWFVAVGFYVAAAEGGILVRLTTPSPRGSDDDAAHRWTERLARREPVTPDEASASDARGEATRGSTNRTSDLAGTNCGPRIPTTVQPPNGVPRGSGRAGRPEERAVLRSAA